MALPVRAFIIPGWPNIQGDGFARAGLHELIYLSALFHNKTELTVSSDLAVRSVQQAQTPSVQTRQPQQSVSG
eukprot:2111246-Prorocentrum_lima.AAC.1